MKWLVVLLLALVPVACSDSVAPVPQQSDVTGNLTFLNFTPIAFSAAQPSASFWAVKGRATKVALRYSDTGETFLEFKVDSASLQSRPDGTPFENGDSVLITVAADANGRFVFDFSPAGLTFNSAAPARLTLYYGRTNPDIDGDGSLTAFDSSLASAASIWKQDNPQVPWVNLPTARPDKNVARADVQHFTEFGMAVN